MKIGLMADMYKPYISGVTNHIETIYKALSAAGHEVIIFTLGGLDHEDTDEVVMRSRGIPIELPFADLSFQWGRNHGSAAIQKIQSMDIINIHHPFMSGSMAYRYCHPKNIPVVFTSHTRYDLYADIYTPFLPRKLVRKLVASNLRRVCRKFDAVITPSNSSRSMYEGLGVEANFVHVPHGICLDSIDNAASSLDKEALGFHRDDVVIIHSGRIGPEKNLPLLMDSFRRLVATHSNARLVIVGRGTELEKLKKQAGNLEIDQFVHVKGFVPHRDVPKYLLMADLFLTASTTEILPLSVLEAMGAGLPVVGVNASGVGEVVTHQETGLLSGSEADAICQNLAALIDRPQLRKSMGVRAREAMQFFDIKNTHKVLEQNFQQIIEQKKSEKNCRQRL